MHASTRAFAALDPPSCSYAQHSPACAHLWPARSCIGQPHVPVRHTSAGYSRARPCTSTAPVANTSSVTVSELQPWDVVLYRQQHGGAQRLGLVADVHSTAIEVEPLVEEDTAVWVQEEGASSELVPAESLLSIIEHDYTQRQDKEHNPHGEHAHDVWLVLQTLPPDVMRQPPL